MYEKKKERCIEMGIIKSSTLYKKKKNNPYIHTRIKYLQLFCVTQYFLCVYMHAYKKEKKKRTRRSEN
jgi:hypothetical protein